MSACIKERKKYVLELPFVYEWTATKWTTLMLLYQCNVPLFPSLSSSSSVALLCYVHFPSLQSGLCSSLTVPWFYQQRCQQPLQCLREQQSYKTKMEILHKIHIFMFHEPWTINHNYMLHMTKKCMVSLMSPANQ